MGVGLVAGQLLCRRKIDAAAREAGAARLHLLRAQNDVCGLRVRLVEELGASLLDGEVRESSCGLPRAYEVDLLNGVTPGAAGRVEGPGAGSPGAVLIEGRLSRDGDWNITCGSIGTGLV